MRQETTTRTLYKFNELTPDAMKRALEKLYDINVDYDWWDYTYEDAERIAKILGITFDQKPVKLMNGSTRYDPAIYFSGFSSQGDGACYEGRYEYAKGASKGIRDYAPTDTELHIIADELTALQEPWFYGLTATITHSGNYSHEYTMDIEVAHKRDETRCNQGAEWAPLPEDELTDLLRRFAKWIYRSLEAEYNHLTSEEAIIETIEANDFEFDEEGNVA